MSSAIVMASGGIESTTLIASLMKRGQFVIGLYFDLGLPSHEHQLHCAKATLNGGNGRLEHIDVRGMKSMFLQFIPADQIMGEADKLCTDVEFMPIYASVATYYAEASAVDAIYLGFTQDQVNPQRSKFFRTLGTTFAAYQSGLKPVAIKTPFAKQDKAGVVAEGAKLGVDYKRTWSCLYGGASQCGVCERCKARKRAFASARIKDPTVYARP